MEEKCLGNISLKHEVYKKLEAELDVKEVEFKELKQNTMFYEMQYSFLGYNTLLSYRRVKVQLYTPILCATLMGSKFFKEYQNIVTLSPFWYSFT
jgi:hypothetical protein